MKLVAIIDDFIARHRLKAQRELRYYAIQRSLADAIREAALSRLPSGKRHPHQRRISGRVLKIVEKKLQKVAAQLEATSSFQELHVLVAQVGRSVRGIGALAIYDIAQRIGAYLKLEPDLVYLHTGTRDGARALGIG